MPGMNSPALWTEAWQAALPVWGHAVRHAGWHPLLVAAAQSTAGLLCLAIGRAERAADGAVLVWNAAAVTLLALALNTLFALDLLAVQVLRNLAHLQGWHDSRRQVQAVVLALLGMLALKAALHLGQRIDLRADGLRWLVPGLVVLVVLAVLRGVSLHVTDAFIQGRLAGMSVGRLLDALGLALVVGGMASALRARLV